MEQNQKEMLNAVNQYCEGAITFHELIAKIASLAFDMEYSNKAPDLVSFAVLKVNIKDKDGD